MENQISAKQILETMSTAVAIVNEAQKITFLNPAAEMLFNVSFRQVAGLGLEEMLAGPEYFFELIQRSLEANRHFREQGIVLQMREGTRVAMDCTVTPFQEPGIEVHLLIELMSVDHQLRIFNEEQLIAQQSAMKKILRGMAHEIKNPLGGLRGAAQLLEQEFEDESLKEYTGIIIREADRLRHLVDRMLGPRSKPNWQQINIHEVLEHVLAITKPSLPRQVSVVRDYDPSIPNLDADPDLLIQAILNIVNNAVQAIGEQGTLRVKTRALRQLTIGKRSHRLVAKIEIIDTGPGIPAEIHQTLFMPMVTKKEGGTGLGLSIAQSIIRQHGGLIEWKSEPGNTVFSILIPLERRNE